ncbi:MAG: hypothetical protein H0U49_02425 [Parachlamydiaceae bacterium]|nr:hypothetical protein [Parachlamydiaceae bacterium]
MHIERRALYNLMRMNWLLDPTLPAEPWQVEDYRALPTITILERLNLHDIVLDKDNFVAYAEQVDSPEELVDMFIGDSEVDIATQDKIYLLVFELWRRLVTDRPCLSVFCDELDHQIYLYDNDKSDTNIESLQDVVASLQTILDENTDNGVDATEVFASICTGCANDIESFLYDYISDNLDHGNEAYASDLVDGFINYVKDVKWFDFLRVRLAVLQNHPDAQRFLQQLLEHYSSDKDLEFNMELLSFMVQHVGKEPFIKLIKKTLPLIVTEEDFQDLMTLCIDFHHFLDLESKEQALQKLLRRRTHIHPEGLLNPKDAAIAELLAIIS